MLIIIDKNTKKVITNHGTNSMYPDGNIPNITLNENEEAVRIHDDSEDSKLVFEACDYSFENGALKVNKTIKQYHEDIKETPKHKRKQIEDQLRELDLKFLDARLIEDLIKKNPIQQSKLDIIAQKESLRQQLLELEV